jgi:hypothetical protein
MYVCVIYVYTVLTILQATGATSIYQEPSPAILQNSKATHCMNSPENSMATDHTMAGVCGASSSLGLSKQQTNCVEGPGGCCATHVPAGLGMLENERGQPEGFHHVSPLPSLDITRRQYIG